MKRSILILSAIVTFSLFCSTTCEEDGGFTKAKIVEDFIYKEIKSYRIDNNLNGDFVFQFVMLKEAQQYSYRMAYGLIPFDTTNIDTHWDIIHDKLGGENELILIQKTTSESVSEIVDYWRNDSTFNSKLLGNYTQCAVGFEYDTANVAYITLLMMLYED